MTISKDEATAALGEIDAARGRVWQAKAYGHASPFVIVWGVVWMGADLAIQFEPRWVWAWPIAATLGAIASLALGVLMPPKGTAAAGRRRIDWRSAAVFVVIATFVTALFLVLPPVSGRSIHSVFGLLFGSLYAGIGLWMGWRLVALGAALVVLTLVGFYAVGAWYPAFMGLVCGSALILGGLWLRKL